METPICKINSYGCIYHACMSENCQKQVVIDQGLNWGEGNCEIKERRELHHD